MPLLCNAQQARLVLECVDERIAPFLMRYVSSGTDELFERLSALPLQVDAPEIDAVLAALLYRWTKHQQAPGSNPDGITNLLKCF